MRKTFYISMIYLAWGAYFALLFARILSMRDDGLYAGHVNVWSDWALHIGLARIFATKAPRDWFAYHIVFADGKLTYAFLVNLLSGLLMRAGVGVVAAFALPSIALAALLIEGMRRLWTRVLGTAERACLAVSLFFLSSGTGFLDYISDVYHGQGLAPAREYTRIEPYTWLSGNYVVGHLVPQRAFLLGMTLAVWGLAGLLGVLLARPAFAPLTGRDKRVLVASGLALGLLPIAHAHSLIAMTLVLLPLFAVTARRAKLWAWFALPGGTLAVVLYSLFIKGGIQKAGFMSLLPGYTAHGFGDWLGLWLRVWGPALPLAGIALAAQLARGRRLEVPALFAGFFLLFGFSNLVLTQPMVWDNSKHFLWVYFGIAALAADALADLWRRRAARPVVALLALSLAFTGALELWLLQRIDTHRFQFIGREELELAERIREGTGPRDRFLTEPTHNHAVAVWAARPVLLGYPSWAWNYGFDYEPILRDLPVMYHGGEAAKALLRKHRVSYVYVGPGETREYQPDEAFYRAAFPLAFSSPCCRVYDTRALLDGAE